MKHLFFGIYRILYEPFCIGALLAILSILFFYIKRRNIWFIVTMKIASSAGQDAKLPGNLLCQPGGLLVMGGKEWHAANSNGFFGIMKDGKLLICATAEEIKETAGTENFEQAFVAIVKGVGE